MWLTVGESSAGGTDYTDSMTLAVAVAAAGKGGVGRRGAALAACRSAALAAVQHACCCAAVCCVLHLQCLTHCMRLPPFDPKQRLAAPAQACTVAGCLLDVVNTRPVVPAAPVGPGGAAHGACLPLHLCVIPAGPIFTHGWLLLPACLIRRKGGAKTCRYRWCHCEVEADWCPVVGAPMSCTQLAVCRQHVAAAHAASSALQLAIHRARCW